MKGELKNWRRQQHLAAARAYLCSHGATDVSLTQSGSVHLAWSAAGRRMAISMPTKPGNSEGATSIACQLIRRRYREAGVELRA